MQQVNFWAESDPFSDGKLSEKKNRKGQTFKIPKTAKDAAPKKRRKNKARDSHNDEVPLAKFVEDRGIVTDQVFFFSFFSIGNEITRNLCCLQ